mmetsp:Transcript_19044/g.52174  ORF Transcript_19044/g.52174 Transcript_19044/m.52174 type:complete len:262 (-) Transcript_19044:180-965(-)
MHPFLEVLFFVIISSMRHQQYGVVPIGGLPTTASGTVIIIILVQPFPSIPHDMIVGTGNHAFDPFGLQPKRMNAIFQLLSRDLTLFQFLPHGLHDFPHVTFGTPHGGAVGGDYGCWVVDIVVIITSFLSSFLHHPRRTDHARDRKGWNLVEDLIQFERNARTFSAPLFGGLSGQEFALGMQKRDGLLVLEGRRGRRASFQTKVNAVGRDAFDSDGANVGDPSVRRHGNGNSPIRLGESLSQSVAQSPRLAFLLQHVQGIRR